jgi:hypothetical protein
MRNQVPGITRVFACRLRVLCRRLRQPAGNQENGGGKSYNYLLHRINGLMPTRKYTQPGYLSKRLYIMDWRK